MENINQNSLKIAYWNVEGLKLSSSDPKTEDPRFVSEIKKHDIICLAETHCSEEQYINVDGYRCFKICRSKAKRVNRYFGGIAILYKESLQAGVKFLEHKNNDYVWVKLSK
jgi:exonuclease III